MKVLSFQQMPYRNLPSDFAQKHNSVVNTPYNELVKASEMHEYHVNFLDEMMHAARSGFDGLATTEHGQAAYDILPNPNLQMAALAYATQSENLDVAICNVGRSLGKSKEALRIAEEYAVLDQISGGRLIAGFPVALSFDANQNNGVPPIETRARYAENRDLIEQAWSRDEVFAFNGKFNKHPYVNIWPRPAQKRPPVWAPAIGNPNTFKNIIANDDAFLYLSWFGPKLTGQRIFDRWWDMCEEHGRDRNPNRLAFVQCVAVGETDEEAHRIYKPHVEAAFRNGLGSIPIQGLGLPGYMDIKGVEHIVKDPGDFGLVMKMRDIQYQELVDNQACIVGGPETVKEQLVELVKNFRIGNLVLMVQHGSMPHELTKKNISLLAEKVLPDLKGIWEDEGWDHDWWPTGIQS